MRATLTIAALLTIVGMELKAQNVGIGITSPSAKLEIRGNGITSSTTALHIFDNNLNPLISVKDNGEFAIHQGNLVIGIGTGIPEYRLDVGGHMNLSGRLNINGVSGNPGQFLRSNGTTPPNWQTVLENPAIGFFSYLAANTAFPSSTTVTLTGFSELYDDGNGFDPAPGAFTAPSSGIYHFDVNVHLASSTTVNDVATQLRLLKNGVILIGGQSTRKLNLNSSFGESLNLVMNIQLTAGDRITVTVLHNSVASFTLVGGTSTTACSFSGFKVY